MITTYVLATEQPSRGCSLTTSKQSKGAPVLYDKGLGQGFPREESECCLIDLAVHSDDELTVLGKDKYPLVIRLETITEQGMQEGHTLEELKPGGEQMPWVQSQTTFAALQRDEDDGNRYKIRILKQKIWINSSSYELQEIYGLQPGVSAKAVAISEDSEERLCVVCLVNEKDTTVLPCRHMCMCHECAQELRKQTSKCPICREQVESLLHIKLRKDKSARS
jgi:E3 ubiquitin-protein ligase MGRN1